MKPHQIIEQAETYGITLSLAGEKLRLHYADGVASANPELLNLLKRHKKAIMAIIKDRTSLASLSLAWRQDLIHAVNASRRAGYDLETISRFDMASHPHLTLDQIQAAWNYTTTQD